MRNNAIDFKLDSVEQLFSNTEKYGEQLVEFFMEMNKPTLKRRQVDISSKTISDWINFGLIDIDTKEDKRHNFSFVEGIWLNFVNELRFFGVSVPVIKELKEMLMDKSITSYFQQEEFVNQFKDKSPAYLEAVNTFRNDVIKSPDEVEQVFKDVQINTFLLLIASTMILGFDLGYYFDHDAAYIVCLNKYETELDERIAKDVFMRMAKKSFALISFKELIADFFDNDELDSLKGISMSFLNSNERDLINTIRTGKYTQIQIKLVDETITHLKLTKKNNELMINKISRLLKKGEYKDVLFTTKDGTIVKFEEVESVKLNK